MNFTIYTVTLLIALSSACFASLGRKIEPNKIPHGLCRLTLEKSYSGETFHCTGSVIGQNLIKTAAHCFHTSTLKKVTCLGHGEVNFEDHVIFPNFNHNQIQRQQYWRYQDLALIHTNSNLSKISFALFQNKLEPNKINDYDQCLMAGHGLHESSPTSTGKLIASLIDPKDLKQVDGIIKVMGKYKYELLPGDSGGPLLCYKNSHWYDLGVASAHNWEHESLYAANSNLSAFNLELIKIKNVKKKIELSSHSIEPKLHKHYILKPYSQLLSLDKKRTFYNGDLNRLKVEVLETLEDEFIRVYFQVNQASQFFLCQADFLCYFDKYELLVKKSDLIEPLPKRDELSILNL